MYLHPCKQSGDAKAENCSRHFLSTYIHVGTDFMLLQSPSTYIHVGNGKEPIYSDYRCAIEGKSGEKKTIR